VLVLEYSDEDTGVLAPLVLLTACILGELPGVVADPLRSSRPGDFEDLLLSLFILCLIHFHMIVKYVR
jgi:hypothetical protein